MITYKLAKQLKEAGFPQGPKQRLIDEVKKDEKDLVHRKIWKEELRTNEKMPSNAVFLIPNLSELINACGDKMLGFGPKCHLGDKGMWYADSRTEPCYCKKCEAKLKKDPEYFNVNWCYKEGKSPEEAVAKLWLKLKTHLNG